jgi:crotonobetainyl-CoA:carnitine CoA-transferase CaiB-like acyl-CoA transferase
VIDEQQNVSILKPYRVLDLTERGCMIGGRILADMGADVIKIEPPGGSPSRIGPFFKDTADPEKSLFWFAYNVNKRGITLDLTMPEGRELFKELARKADIVMESFEVGVMGQMGLGYEDLCKVKSDIILTSISPFGQEGPKSRYKGSDLTAWASGGYLYVCGDPDRPPTWISFPQASLHAGAEAASGSLAALWHRNHSGEGQIVDVSMQECSLTPGFNAPEMWDLNKVEFRRFSQGINIGTQGVRVRAIWKCLDGFIIFIAQGGIQPFVGSMKEMVSWMAAEGKAEDWLQAMDWASDYDASRLTQQKVDRVEESLSRFFLTRTKLELYEEGALKRRILIGPLSTTLDIANDRQLQSRDFWVDLSHPELDETISYPGPFVKLSHNPIQYRFRAPMIGEHNSDVYVNELGISRARIAVLENSRII